MATGMLALGGETMADDGSGGAVLHAISNDDPKARLAQHLSTLFKGLDVSQRAYAASHPYNHSVISRYFSGQRVPPWHFIETLMNDLAVSGLPVTEQVREYTRQLFLAALLGGNSTEKCRHHLEILTDKLDRAVDQARLCEQDLLGQIQGQQQRIDALTWQIHNLTGARAAERENLRRMVAGLTDELHHLKDELHRARLGRETAEADYGQHARELAIFEEEATGDAVVGPLITRDGFSGSGSPTGTSSSATPRGRTPRMADVTLDDLVGVAQSVTDPSAKAAALAEAAAALAIYDRARAENLFADAARIAESISDWYIKSWAIGFVASALAPSDRPWAMQLFTEAVHTAKDWIPGKTRAAKWLIAEALAQIAEMMVVSDPAWARRLFADAVRAAKSLPLAKTAVAMMLGSSVPGVSEGVTRDAWSRLSALEAVAKMLAPSDPDQAEELAKLINDPGLKAEALAAVARAVAASDRDRANRLIIDADHAAQLASDPEARDWALGAVGAALTAWDLDEAWRLAALITYQEPKELVLMEAASALATWDPAKAAELAQTIPSEWRKSCALADVAKAMAASDLGQAEQLALSIPDLWKRASALAHIAKLKLHGW